MSNDVESAFIPLTKVTPEFPERCKVIVGGCWGVIALDAKEVVQYYEGAALGAAIALLMACVEVCILLVQ